MQDRNWISASAQHSPASRPFPCSEQSPLSSKRRTSSAMVGRHPTKLISGPCQFPTMGFVVDRWRRVENFVPEPFWSIKLTVLRDDIEVKFSWKRGHLFDRLCCLCLYEMCLEKGMARVASVVTKPKSKWSSTSHLN